VTYGTSIKSMNVAMREIMFSNQRSRFFKNVWSIFKRGFVQIVVHQSMLLSALASPLNIRLNSDVTAQFIRL